ncbi:MAG: TRIC cation channel family protein, partial [Planctomycetes bacterium]|nr:TRIC cation channel family protein [Planctomycetota bacterium]
LFWIENEHYTWTVFGIALAGAFLPRLPDRLEGWLTIPDALGLALFSIVGAGIAVDSEVIGGSLLVASMFGVMTGAFGGVIADVVCNDVPRIFLPATPLYSVCAFAGCWVFLGLGRLGVDEPAALLLGATTIVVFRLLAVRGNWTLPATRA